MRGPGTMMSPTVRSAMRITPSSMESASGLMMALSSACASFSMRASGVSGLGERNSWKRCQKERLSSRSGAECGSDTVVGAEMQKVEQATKNSGNRACGAT